MKNFLSSTLLLLWLIPAANAQSIFTNAITATNPSADNPFTAGQTVNSNITVSGIGRGSGIGANAGSNRYNANGWNTTSIDLNAYFTFTLTPKAGYTISLTSFVYTGQASGTGPASFAFRSSLSNYASNISTATEGGTTISLAGAAYQNLTSAITFRFYGWGASGASGTYSIDDFTFNGTVDAVLPVELASFSASALDGEIRLIWSTATEIDNDYFSIERSGDGAHYAEIGQVKGAGTSYTKQEYFFTDERPLSGRNYYRLRQTDLAGRMSFSPVVTATTHQNDGWSLFPLPASDHLRLVLQEPFKEDMRWEVFDLNGRALRSGNFPAETTECQIDVSALPGGNYMLRLTRGRDIMAKQFKKCL